jgi:hypothetical protein
MGKVNMRVWIVSRKQELDWDEMEGVFLHQDDAIQHIRDLELDFPSEEFAAESLKVNE